MSEDGRIITQDVTTHVGGSFESGRESMTCRVNETCEVCTWPGGIVDGMGWWE